MAEIKWIKITTDIFDDEKILLIESMPEADSMIVIWFKLLAFAGKSNNNGVFMLSEKMPYTDEMLATIFRRPLNTVRFALQTFENFGMIERIDGVYIIQNWNKHQNIDGMEKIREQNRIRKQNQRARQKQLLLTTTEAAEQEAPAEDKPENNTKNLSCDMSRDVTQQKEEGRRKKEDKEKDKDKDKEKEKEDLRSICETIVSYLNARIGSKFRSTTKETVKHIHARLAEGFTVEDFKTVIDKKAHQWLYDPKMAEYLRPSTLFGPKFEAYLETPVSIKKTGRAGIELAPEPEDDILKGIL